MLRHAERGERDRVGSNRRTSWTLGSGTTALALAPQQADHSPFDADLRLLDLGIVEADFEILAEVKIHRCQGRLGRMTAGDRHTGHGHDHDVRRWLRDINVARAGVRETGALRRYMRVPGAECDRNRRR